MMKWMTMMRFAAAALLSVACGSGSSTGGLDAEASYLVALTPGSEVPAPAPTTASGIAQIIVYAARIDYQISVSSITGVTTAHIHNGAPGVVGPVAVTLFQISTPTDMINGVLATGSLTAGDLPAGTTLESLKTLLLSGNAYVDVHTSLNPTGEIRGQIK